VTRVLLTGAGGFAGHHCLEHILANTSWDVIATDSFRHKGKTDRIAEVLRAHDQPAGWGDYWSKRTRVIAHDLSAPFSRQSVLAMTDVDYVIAYASESHVDRSIADPVPFVTNNNGVALTTLELCRAITPRALVWVSTDEVYGPQYAGEPPFPEWSPILPSNPYAASKAAQEALCISYWRTYGVPVIIVNGMNMIGERQDPEKFVPKVIKAVLEDREVTVHGTPGDIGTRHYLHARNMADGILFLLENTVPAVFPAHAADAVFSHHSTMNLRFDVRPDRYNIASADRVDNLFLAGRIAAMAGRVLRYRLEDFHTQRPGHDPHYGLDPAKITRLGWQPPVPFDESLDRTVKWTVENPAWLDE
jgi:dTDP-glucose 4,6-dehydratase